jgi:hypothetical protein
MDATTTIEAIEALHETMAGIGLLLVIGVGTIVGLIIARYG